MDFSGVAAELTVQAELDADDERLAVLAAIGDALVQQALDLTAGREDAEEQVTIAEAVGGDPAPGEPSPRAVRRRHQRSSSTLPAMSRRT